MEKLLPSRGVRPFLLDHVASVSARRLKRFESAVGLDAIQPWRNQRRNTVESTARIRDLTGLGTGLGRPEALLSPEFACQPA
jgi:hypothetical protein